MPATTVPRCGLAALAALGLGLGAPAVAHAAAGAGAPGAKTTWTRADKDGFGTAVGGSRVWFTLSRGELTEVYYPRLDTPSVRDLELVVSDGRTFTERETVATRHAVRRLDGLTFQQVNTASSGRYRTRPVIEGGQSGRACRRRFGARPLARPPIRARAAFRI